MDGTMNKWIGMIPVALVAVCGVEAASVVLDPEADIDIRSKDLADNGYNRNVMVIGHNGDPSVTRAYKAYVRFQLPADFGTATNATFTMTRALVGAWGWNYEVSGMNDGITNETTYSIANGTGVGTTWNNAPANITTSPYQFSDSSVVGTFSTVKAADGGFAGDSWSISGTDLVNFLNADSNGFVTLMIGRDGVSTSMDQWAAYEWSGGTGTGYSGPKLELEYTPDETNPLVSLLPDADADIRSAELVDIGYDRTTLSVINAGSDPTVVTNAKAYVRFKLPSGFDAALTATFTVTRAVVGVWAPTYNISVLNDGVSNETDWVELDGEGGMSWNNAPGNNLTSAYEFTNSTWVGSFQVSKVIDGGYVGDSYSVGGENLINVLNADSNGYVTFMIGRDGVSTSSDLWASSEHPTNSWAPMLTLKYAGVPAYPAWISQYPGVGAATNMTDNPDGDILNNLAEFALGGNPADPADRGHVPTSGIAEVGGTNWFGYVYAKRENAEAKGLTYSVEQNTDLVYGVWTTNTVEVLGSGTLDSEFNTVTNRIPADVEDRQFLKLIIESN